MAEISDSDAMEIGRVWRDAAPLPRDPLPERHLAVSVSPEIPIHYELASLSQRVTLAAIEARRGQLWMLHAAGVADQQGRVIVLIGPSGQGKTTAASVLGAHYGYVSDETIGIASDGRVVPYRKPLSVIEDGAHVKVQRSPDELGLRSLPEAPLRLAALVLLDRRADAPGIPVIEECELGDVLSDLIAQTSYIADLPTPLRTIAAHAAAVGGVRRVIYREATTLPEALAPLFKEPAGIAVAESILEPRPAADGPGFYRAVFLDALQLQEPDRLALLQPDLPEGATFRLVAGIGPALWRAASGVGQNELTEAAVAAYGEPVAVDLAAAVGVAVAELTQQAVLVAEPSWRLRDDIAVTGGGHRFVVMSLSMASEPVPIALEGSAATIWSALADSRGITTSRLTEVVAEQVGLPEEQVAADIRAFLSTLETAELAERVAP